MSSHAFSAAAMVLLGQALPAQQYLWQVPPGPPSTVQYLGMNSFPDYDRDGYLDFLQVVMPNAFVSSQLAVQIVSGRDGSIILSRPEYSAFPVYAGDVNGDGWPDVAWREWGGGGLYRVKIWSPHTNTILWQTPTYFNNAFGFAMLGNIDVNADGRSDFVAITNSWTSSDAFVYDSSGALLYVVPCYSQGRIAHSLCNMGDMNADGRDDFLIGCADSTARGVLVLVSGANGSVLRFSYGFLPGDYMTDHATNLGDIDGDGVNDYAGFPHLSSTSGLTVQFSGATGNVIRYGYAGADSVIAGQDMDLDGVPDLVIGSGVQVAPNVYGLTRAFSGRDGTELWRVENFRPPPGSTYFNGSQWARYAAGLGVQPGQTYPAIAWMDMDWFISGTVIGGTHVGRVRAYNTALAGQGPIIGAPCSSTSQRPQIGARKTATGARITIAKGPPGALGLLNLALAPQTTYGGLPLPIDLSFMGMPGCKAYVGPQAHYWRVLGTTGIDRGYAAVDLPFPLTTVEKGLQIAAQWLVFDPATLVYAATAMHQLRGP